MAIILTDSTCDLTLEEIKQLNIEMLSLTVHFQNESYIDKITLSNEDFYKKLDECDEIPSTALLNPADFLTIFEKYPDDDIIVITIASKLSGTYQSANIAKSMSERENIYIINSETVTVGLGLLVKVAANWNKEGKSTLEIVNDIEHLKTKVRLVAIIDTLKYLVKGGRLSGVAGAVGTALNLKPLVEIKDGEVVPLTKVRGNKAAFKELLSIVEKDLPFQENLPIAYAHTNNYEMLETLQTAIALEGESYLIGSVVGTHAGPGAVAISYFIS